MYKTIHLTLNCFCMLALLAFNSASFAAPVYQNVGTATNSSKPSEWEEQSFDITDMIAGAASAILTFDLRNDAPVNGRVAHSTTSSVAFGVDGSDYYVQFAYVSGQDSSHWRNVALVIDGLRYVDQYGANNNHLGDSNYGTAWQGLSFIGNILGDGNGATYVLSFDPNSVPVSSVPVPAAVWLFGTGLLAVFSSRRRKV